MNKKLIKILCILAIFIPTYIAVIFYISAQNQPVNDRAVESLILKASDGRTYNFDKEGEEKAEAKKMISFFIDLNDNAKKVSSIPQKVTENGYLTAVYNSYGKDKTYKYYISSNSEECYFADSNGRYYLIDQADAKTFLSMKYAESIYPGAAEPVLTLADASLVTPTSFSWMYKNINGEFTPTVSTGTKNISQTFPIAGGLTLNFTKNPDYLNVKITRDGNIIYDDTYETLSSSVIGDTISTLDVEVTAKWYQTTDSTSYGEAVYNFVANVSAPAVFYLGEDTIEQGEFVAITGRNVADVSTLTFTSEPAIDFTPTFYKEGDYVIALVPISIDLEYSSQYKFTVNSGGQIHNMILNVEKRATKATISYDIPLETVNRTRNSTTVSAFNNAISSAISETSSTRYFSGIFNEPVPGRSIKTGFGRLRKINSTGEIYTHMGIDYVVQAGDRITAANGGIVVYEGETVYAGKVLIIDHGLGLQSRYLHMGDFSVAVGDKVETGTVLGSVGTGGFTTGISCHYELTVGGISVSPYSVFEKGLPMYLG